jgi:hypothetical protein
MSFEIRSVPELTEKSAIRFIKRMIKVKPKKQIKKNTLVEKVEKERYERGQQNDSTTEK